MTLHIRPTPAGAEVTGVQIASLTASQEKALADAFSQHGALFFREQSIDELQHIAFARRWGNININRFFRRHREYDEIAMVVKTPDYAQNIGGSWHADHSYDPEPALGSVLVARELPDTGGDTLFASMTRAYAGLDDATKRQISSLSAVHSGSQAFGTKADGYDAADSRFENADVADALADVVHPLVIKHPLSGQSTLFVNPGFTVGVVGMTEEASTELLHMLFTHALSPRYVYRLQWRPGTVALWDNRACLLYTSPSPRDATLSRMPSSA